MKKILVLSSLMCLLSGNLFAFKAFTTSKNVCRSCTQEKADEIELKSGTTIRVVIVGENPDEYIAYRYSELRAIPRSEIKNIKWAQGSKPSELSSTDTVVLKNGVVFAGKIITNTTKPAVIQIKSEFNGFTYTIFKSEIHKAYKAGTKLI